MYHPAGMLGVAYKFGIVWHYDSEKYVYMYHVNHMAASRGRIVHGL